MEAKKKKVFSSHRVSFSSWANTQIFRGRLTEENVQSLSYRCTFGGVTKMRPEMHWAVEAYVCIMDKGVKGDRGLGFPREIDNLQAAETELNTW